MSAASSCSRANAVPAMLLAPCEPRLQALKAGVTATSRYEPGINRTYQELAEHYDTTILPTRPRKPRDKAKVEVAVQIVQRFVLARLRNAASSRSLNSMLRSARGSTTSTPRSYASSE